MSNTTTKSNNSWNDRLRKKLSTLIDTSSKETIQTIAKWIVFHRKQYEQFIPVLIPQCYNRLVIMYIINEILILYKDIAHKWDRLTDFRINIGEALISGLDNNNNNIINRDVIDKLKSTILNEWDNCNSFDGPTIIRQIRKKLVAAAAASSNKTTTTTTVEKKIDTTTTTTSSSPSKDKQVVVKETTVTSPKATDTATKTSKKDTTTIKPVVDEKTTTATATADDEDDNKTDSKLPSTNKVTTTKDKSTVEETNKPAASSNNNISSPITNHKQQQQHDNEYDFDVTGVIEKEIDSKEFIEPCRTIATLQIARDLRSDVANQVSSLLSALPDRIRTITAEAAELELDKVVLPDDITKNELLHNVPDILLDMDWDEQIQAIITYRDIITKQNIARQNVVHLLQQSRCKFGSMKFAKSYYDTDVLVNTLHNRATLLADAMELEGLDVTTDDVPMKKEEEEDDDNDKQDYDENEVLPPLSWYNNKDNNSKDEGSSTKKQKVS